MLDCVITSPPYADSVNGGQHGIDPTKGKQAQDRPRSVKRNRELLVEDTTYGCTRGQLGGLPVGDLDAVLCSPPYADSDQDYRAGWARVDRTKGVHRRHSSQEAANYGLTPGQVGALKAEDYPVQQEVACEELVWQGCYEDSWKGVLPDAAFRHPAKFAFGLARRIVRFGLERGFWAPGDLVGDCFGGVGCGGLVCAYEGLRWVGVELEEKFVTLAEEVFARHRRNWEALRYPQPRMIQGDSRGFAEIVGAAQAVVTSPPWAECDVDRGQAKIDFESKRQAARGRDPNGAGHLGSCASYGASPGQVGALPAGGLDGVLTSPPYENFPDKLGKIDWSKTHHGSRAAAYANGVAAGADGCDGYGHSEGQVGITEGETYWQAVRLIYGQCRLALKPQGVLCCVLKPYVKQGRLVDLPGQTVALLEHLGFTVFLKVKASLVKETRAPGLFEPEVVRRKERKSFFRRLCEKRGSPAIDAETVLFARSPA